MPASPIRRAGKNLKNSCFSARCRSWSKIWLCCVSLFTWRACVGAPGGAGGHLGPSLRYIWSVHPVGADLRVRPPLLGAHIGAPLHSGAPGRSSSWPGGPQARRGNPHPPQRKTDSTGLSAPRNGRGRRVKDASPYRVRTICRGRCPHRPAAAQKLSSFAQVPACRGTAVLVKQNEK